MASHFALLATVVTLVLTLSVHNNNVVEAASMLKTGALAIPSSANPSAIKYVVSTNAAQWSDALNDCRLSFQPNSHLLSIESQDELNYIKEYLEGFGLATTFWTSGRYDDTSSTKYRWSAFMKPLAPFLPWAPNQPPQSGSPIYRVALKHMSAASSQIQVNASTVPFRYICEAEDEETDIPIPCYANNDLIIILDASGSISPSDYQMGKEFVARLVSAFTGYIENRLAFMIFSTSTQFQFQMTRPFNPSQLESWIKMAPHPAGSTDTAAALSRAISHFDSNPRAVPKNMVIITDGQSNNPAQTQQMAIAAKNKGIRMFSVGITTSTNSEELYYLAGQDVENMFYADTFEKLIALLTPTTVRVCPDT
jgi:hypothetical protein